MLKAIVKRRVQTLTILISLAVVLAVAIPFVASAMNQKAVGTDEGGKLQFLAKGGNGNGSDSGKGCGGNNGVGGNGMDTGFIYQWMGRDGGTITIGEGFYFVVPKEALKKDVEIGVRMKRDLKQKKTKFYFTPAGLEFHKSARLLGTWEAISDAAESSPGLQYAVEMDGIIHDIGSPIPPEGEIWGVTWKIDHFSIYYYRTR